MGGMTLPAGHQRRAGRDPRGPRGRHAAEPKVNPMTSTANAAATPPISALVYWAGGNPFHHHQDLNRLHEAWTRPETIIVNEPWWTRHRPARRYSCSRRTTPYERERDIGGAAPLDDYLFHMPAPHPARGRSARRLRDLSPGWPSAWVWAMPFNRRGAMPTAWDRPSLQPGSTGARRPAGISVPPLTETSQRERNLGQARHRHPARNRPKPILRRFRADPEGAALKTPSGRIEIFSERIDGFGYDDCPGHPVWLPPAEWPGAATKPPPRPRRPCTSSPPQPGDKLHSQLEAGAGGWVEARAARDHLSSMKRMRPAGASANRRSRAACSTGRGATRARAAGVTPDILGGCRRTAHWRGGSGRRAETSTRRATPTWLTRDVGHLAPRAGHQRPCPRWSEVEKA